jgi:hypothetical protein
MHNFCLAPSVSASSFGAIIVTSNPAYLPFRFTSHHPMSEMLTKNGVSFLVDSSLSLSSEILCLQVIRLQTTYSPSGHRRVILTLSDGQYFTESLLSPQLFHLFDTGKIVTNDIVNVTRFTVNSIGSEKSIFLLALTVKKGMADVIGSPDPIKIDKNMPSAPVDDSGVSVKRKSYIMANDHGDVDTFPSKPDDTISIIECSSCNSNPCEWVKYGPSVIKQIEDDYLSSEEVIGNRQLRFVAYSAYSNMKHGYLGKRNRIPLPPCVESGIRNKYPDSTNSYVGFKFSKVN